MLSVIYSENYENREGIICYGPVLLQPATSLARKSNKFYAQNSFMVECKSWMVSAHCGIYSQVEFVYGCVAWAKTYIS